MMTTDELLVAIDLTLRTYLPAAITAANLPLIKKYIIGRVTPAHSEQSPYCWVFTNSWTQPTTPGARTIGGIHGAHVNRPYTVYVCIAAQGSDEAALDMLLYNYLDVMTEVLEEHWTFGKDGFVLNSDVIEGSASPNLEKPGAKVHFRMSALTLNVLTGRILGGTS